MKIFKYSFLLPLLAAPVAALAVPPPATTAAPASAPVAAPAAAFSTGAPAKAAQPVDQVARQFARWDTDRNGSLTLEEFRVGYLQAERNMAIAQLRQQFVARDTDKSGYLEKGEYEALPLVKKEGAKAAPFAQVDKNGDGRLDFSEYAAMVAKAVEERR
jgi:Ca2+-binding EF-hand superfamily protein